MTHVFRLTKGEFSQKSLKINGNPITVFDPYYTILAVLHKFARGISKHPFDARANHYKGGWIKETYVFSTVLRPLESCKNSYVKILMNAKHIQFI